MQDIFFCQMIFQHKDTTWEQRKVFEIADRFDNLRVPVAANLRIPGNTPYYGANGIQDYVEGYTHDGEYILVAEDGASDLKNYPVNYVNGRIWVNNHAHVLQGKEKIANNKFLSYAMRLADIESVLVGGGRAKLNADIMMNLDIAIPSFNEQEQIGAYFSNLDNLITLHQRKYNKLLNVKKSMLEKMFPKNGSNIPEIRFKGFTDPWEQRKFGDVGSVSMCKRIFKNETSDGGDIPFYKIGTFGGEPDAYISRELFEEYKKKFSYPNEGDILLSASGTIGRIVEYTGEDAYFQDSNIVWLSHDKSICNKFLKVLYPTVKWDGIEGSTIKRLYNDNFLKTQFMMPKIEEQERLGEYFEQLDHLITLHQRELEKLQNIKKSMLEKMFV